MTANPVAGGLVAMVQVATVGAVYWFTTGHYAGVAKSLGNQVERFGNLGPEDEPAPDGTT